MVRCCKISCLRHDRILAKFFGDGGGRFGSLLLRGGHWRALHESGLFAILATSPRRTRLLPGKEQSQMHRLAISELTTFRWTFEEDVHNLAASGITAIGIWRQKLSDFGEEKGLELLAEYGVSVSSLAWVGGFTGSDGRSYRDSVRDAREAIQLAGLLRAPSVIVYSGARGGHTSNHARRLFKNALADLLPHAAEHGVALAIKPLHPGCAADWTFLVDLDSTIALIEDLSDPRLKLAFDSYHFGFHEDCVDRIASIIDHIGLVQLGDGHDPPRGEQNRCRLGDGCIPLVDIVRTLDSGGYRGFYEVKLLGEDVEPFTYHELIHHAKSVFAGWGVSSHVS